MYQFSAKRDQQQVTTLTITKGNNLIMIKTTRITSTSLIQAQNRLIIQFNIHENHQESAKWASLEHALRIDYQDFVAAELLPTSLLKVHIFILNADKDVESAIFNGTWVCLVLHGVPLKRSVFEYQWGSGSQHNKGIFDLHSPKTILAGLYNSPPPADIQKICGEYKSLVREFLKREWVK